MNRLALAVALVLLVAAFAGAGMPARAAGPIFVDADATGANNGTSWADAYTSLQAALTAASAPAEIWVAEGVYRPTAGGDRTQTFALETGVAVYGGFAGGETERGQRDPVANPTVLSGDIGSAGFADDNSFHVVTGGSVGSSAVLDGFTVTGGNADGSFPDNQGAGITIASGNPTLANLVVAGNNATSGGGGLYVDSGSPTVTDFAVRRNIAQFGGGIRVDTGAPTFSRGSVDGNAATDGAGLGLFNSGQVTLTNVTVRNNTATGDAGGLWLEGGSTATLSNVTIEGNFSALDGGGLYDDGSTATLSNITFSGNSAMGNGGGLYHEGVAGATLRNVTFANNTAGQSGGGVFDESAATITQSILWANTPDQLFDQAGGAAPSIVRSLVQGGCPTGATCNPAETLTSDPLLGQLADNGGATETHALLAGSPAIDAGDNAACATTDQRGTARPVDGDVDGTATCDLGAIEFAPGTPSVAFAAARSSASESVTTVDIPVQLSGKSPNTVTVVYRVAGGTAKGGGRDYTLAAGTLSFSPGATARNITIAVVNDRFDEARETIVVALSSPTSATLGSKAVHTHVIVDNDPRILCRGRVPTLIGTNGNDTLTGRPGADMIVGLGGNDVINGRGGDDVICAGAGNDTVRGGGGNDALYGEDGRDRLQGGPGSGDLCDGGAGADALLRAHGCEVSPGVP